ncbi:hypothetical protein K439DRAFT_826404 [Ramaria rubella]|nr:hypothetical protein K439DRAFT_826404 [Ramaria rubella]
MRLTRNTYVSQFVPIPNRARIGPIVSPSFLSSVSLIVLEAIPHPASFHPSFCTCTFLHSSFVSIAAIAESDSHACLAAAACIRVLRLLCNNSTIITEGTLGAVESPSVTIHLRRPASDLTRPFGLSRLNLQSHTALGRPAPQASRKPHFQNSPQSAKIQNNSNPLLKGRSSEARWVARPLGPNMCSRPNRLAQWE